MRVSRPTEKSAQEAPKEATTQQCFLSAVYYLVLGDSLGLYAPPAIRSAV